MKPHRVAILFDSHTPYLSFRVNALQKELLARGWEKHIELHVILIAADWSTYGWNSTGLQGLYEVPVHVLSKEFHGLGLKSVLHPSVPKMLLKLSVLYYRLRPRVTLVGGYDRPSSLWCRLLSYPLLAKVGVMHDSRFNDAESFSKNVTLEMVKSLAVARYSFFMCSGRECADYTRFLAGRKAKAYTEAWNVVDNDAIARSADDASQDGSVWEKLGLSAGRPFFFCPARFVAKKNLPFVIRAYSSYVKGLADPSAAQSLVLCGQGPDKELVVGAIEANGVRDQVKICAWLPYELMPRACRLSTALLLASTYDQWGMTVNEALSAGTPVLVSNRAGAHELVRNEQNGFTFDPRDEAHLTHLLRYLHDSPEAVARLRNGCRASMESFSARQYVERHLEMLGDFGLLPGK